MNNSSHPLITVRLITYNHEKYIEKAIYSILNQTFTDYELIIVNDGSTDQTDSIIKGILKTENNPKIRYIYQENQGVSSACNVAILNAKGKYIANMSGDDISYPHRLQRQVEFIKETKAKILFSWVDIIDDDGNITIGENKSLEKFNQPRKTHLEMLKYFFFRGNYLNSVTGLIEKELLFQQGIYSLPLIQLQDFDMWLKIIKHDRIYILPEKLIQYRIRSNNNNLSAPKPENLQRIAFENQLIYKTFFHNFSMDLFREVFHHEIIVKNFYDDVYYQLEKAFLYLQHPFPYIRFIGIENLYNLFQNKSIITIAKFDYNFGLPDLFELTKIKNNK